LFNFDEGLDDQICELLTIKIKQVAQEYSALMRDQERTVEAQQSMIGKYKALTPKTFKLVELTMEELFGSIARIHTDAFLVWNHLTTAYPPDYFVGCIEDTFGAFFDNESQDKLYGELQAVSEALS